MKYKNGKQIKSMCDFEHSNKQSFIVVFNRPKIVHRSFLISWQYRTLKQFIDGGRVFETEQEAENKCNKGIKE